MGILLALTLALLTPTHDLVSMYVVLRDGIDFELEIDRSACEKLNEAVGDHQVVWFGVKETGYIGQVVLVICHSPTDGE